MKLTLTITLSEHEARALWHHAAEDEADPPIGQELADWAAEYAMTTQESSWQYDAGVCADVTAGGTSDTLELLQALIQLPPDHHQRPILLDAMCAGHHESGEDKALAILLAAYADALHHLPTHQAGDVA
jgi:hypothetical protein